LEWEVAVVANRVFALRQFDRCSSQPQAGADRQDSLHDGDWVSGKMVRFRRNSAAPQAEQCHDFARKAAAFIPSVGRELRLGSNLRADLGVDEP
jgi:hypothetical protein